MNGENIGMEDKLLLKSNVYRLHSAAAFTDKNLKVVANMTGNSTLLFFTKLCLLQPQISVN